MAYFSKDKFNNLAKKRGDLKKQIALCTDQETLEKLTQQFDSVENRMTAMCQLIATRYATIGDYRKYPEADLQDMISLATIRCWQKFDLYKYERGLSPLAYFTSAVFSSFCNYLRGYYKQKERIVRIESVENYGDVC